MGHKDINEIINHQWLKDINWDNLESKMLLEENIPFIPYPGDNFDYFKSLPTIGFGETGGQYDANGRKCSGWTNWSPSGHMKPLFNCLGMPNNFTDLGKMCHSKVSSYVFNLDNNKDNKSDVIEWAISQTKK